MATSLGTVELEGVQLLFAGAGLRGSAASMSQTGGGSMVLRLGEFTRCEPKNNGWSLEAKSVEMKEGDVFATTKGTVLKVKSVPIFYAPYLRVPVNDQRQTGLLTPAIGYSSEDGLDLALPYYLNIAANLDATLVPRVMTQRGAGLEGQVRYLSARQRSSLDLAFLSNDDLYNGTLDRRTFRALRNGQVPVGNLPNEFAPADRWLGAVNHFGQFGQIQTRVDFSRASDRDYFRDIDSNLGVSNPINLQRLAEVAYVSPKLQVRLMSQGFQRLDELNTESYERAPQLWVNYATPLGQSIATFGVQAQWAEFDREASGLTGVASAQGSRLHIEPRIRVGQHKSAGFWAAEAGYRYSQYQLNYDDTVFAGTVAETDPSRKVGYLSLDAGLYFDRQSNFAGVQGVQTLEPRIYYLRQGYEDQDDLPIFDTTSISLDYTQLFRNNRFVGLDRIGDADQITLGVTSRFLSAASGRELWSVSVGQIQQFSDYAVTLTNNPLANTQPQSAALAGEVSARLGSRWKIIANQVWDYDASRWQELGATLRYRSDNKHLFNVGFRKRAQDDLEQAEADIISRRKQQKMQFEPSKLGPKSHREKAAFDLNEENKKVDEGADDFDSEGNLIEQNLEAPLNEAIFGGVGMLLLGKLFVFLFKALQSKDELKKLDNTLQQSNAPDAAKEISAKTLELLGTVERNAPALEKAAQATGLGGNLNPLNWKTNALIALSSGAIKKMYGKEDDDISLPEPEVSENNKGIE